MPGYSKMKIENGLERKMATSLSEEKDILFAYLFGSATRGGFNGESDLDIAVYFNNRVEADEQFQKRLHLMEHLQNRTGRKVEVLNLAEMKSIFFKFVIIKEGKVILERDHSSRVDFDLKTMNDYYDFQPFLKEYNRSYIERSLAKKL